MEVRRSGPAKDEEQTSSDDGPKRESRKAADHVTTKDRIEIEDEKFEVRITCWIGKSNQHGTKRQIMRGKETRSMYLVHPLASLTIKES